MKITLSVEKVCFPSRRCNLLTSFPIVSCVITWLCVGQHNFSKVFPHILLFLIVTSPISVLVVTLSFSGKPMFTKIGIITVPNSTWHGNTLEKWTYDRLTHVTMETQIVNTRHYWKNSRIQITLVTMGNYFITPHYGKKQLYRNNTRYYWNANS